MANVTGPISSLPGSRHSTDQMCDEHQDRPAVARIQGETDSFGSEMYDICQECLGQHREHQKNRDASGVCDWCKNHAERLFHKRDIDEGVAGRVYEVCRPCIDRENKILQEELDEYYEDDWGFEF